MELLDNQEDNEDYMKQKIQNAESIKISGIIKQNEQSVASGSVTSGIGYTKDLKEYVINKSNEAEIVKEQKSDFVAISLIVSSIMIGIITYITVLERTKEIGILSFIGSPIRFCRSKIIANCREIRAGNC